MAHLIPEAVAIHGGVLGATESPLRNQGARGNGNPGLRAHHPRAAAARVLLLRRTENLQEHKKRERTRGREVNIIYQVPDIIHKRTRKWQKKNKTGNGRMMDSMDVTGAVDTMDTAGTDIRPILSP